MSPPGKSMGPDEPFAPPRLVRSSVPWNDVDRAARASIRELEARFPHLRASVLVQECDGLTIDKEAAEERIVAGAPFPAEFTGSSFVLSVTNGSTVVEWASDDLGLLERGFEELRPELESLPATGMPLEGEPCSADFAVDVQEPLHEVPLQRKLERLRADFERAGQLAPQAQRVVTAYRETQVVELFVSSNRRMRQQLSRVTRAVYILVPGVGGRLVQARAGRDVQGGFEQAAIHPYTWRQLEQALEQVPRAEPLTPGEYDVIVDGEWAGLIAHEAFGHGSEADMLEKNRARAVNYLGKTLGSPLVELRDSAAEPGRSGSFFFDHLGTLATATPIIQQGVLSRPISARGSGEGLGFRPSSNGRRQSPLHKAYVRMTNTDIVPGESRLEDMVAAVKYGFYLRMPLGGMEDPKGWGIQCQGSVALEIQDGRFTGRCFGPVILTGYLPELLSSVRMVGRDFESDGMGYCGKGYKEFVKTTCGGPAMLLRARLG
ncbi:MAG TPA: TldD/PmbA family protein [Archangium sp.]|nr:TldD/PmbA family protein [Archangium sp.]